MVEHYYSTIGAVLGRRSDHNDVYSTHSISHVGQKRQNIPFLGKIVHIGQTQIFSRKMDVSGSFVDEICFSIAHSIRLAESYT